MFEGMTVERRRGMQPVEGGIDMAQGAALTRFEIGEHLIDETHDTLLDNQLPIPSQLPGRLLAARASAVSATAI